MGHQPLRSQRPRAGHVKSMEDISFCYFLVGLRRLATYIHICIHRSYSRRSIRSSWCLSDADSIAGLSLDSFRSGCNNVAFTFNSELGTCPGMPQGVMAKAVLQCAASTSDLLQADRFRLGSGASFNSSFVFSWLLSLRSRGGGF